MSTAQQKFKIHIAVDFGTDGIGLAYAIDDEVFVHSKWNTIRFGATVKPKMILLLDDAEEATFGIDAKFTYMNLARTNQQKWMLFERFKMALYENKAEHNDSKQQDEQDEEEKKDEVEAEETTHEYQLQSNSMNIKPELTAVNGRSYPSEKVFICVFQHISKESNRLLRRKRIRAQKHEMQWIVTVPAIWSEKAKYQMKQWIIKAGLVDETVDSQCLVVYEPDCAALAIYKEIMSEYQVMQPADCCNPTDDGGSDHGNHDEQYFGEGHKYILIDAGGGTVDVACHEIVGRFGVREIHYPTGGPWGSCYIDDRFVELLESIFSKQWMNEFRHKSTKAFVEMVHNFQDAKEKLAYSEQCGSHQCKLPADFLGFIDEKCLNAEHDQQEDDENMPLNQEDAVSVESIVKSAKINGKNNLITLDDDSLDIDISVWESMFDHVVTPTIRHVCGLLQKSEMKECRYLCLVGGLSCSSYFQYKMEQWFGAKSKYKLQLIIPANPILSVVLGAAHFGVTGNYVQSRKLGKSYAYYMEYAVEEAQEKGIEAAHIEQYKYYDCMEEHWFVRNCLGVIANKGEQVFPDRPCCIHGQIGAHDRKIKIICTDAESPSVLSDEKEIVATYTLPLNAGTLVVTEFYFYETIIKLKTYDPLNPMIATQISLDYH